MKPKTTTITIRLSEDELNQLDQWIAQCSSSHTQRLTRSGLLRLLIRDCIGLTPNFMPKETELLNAFHTAFTTIGRNLNQAVKLVHEGRWPDPPFSHRDVQTLSQLYNQTKHTIRLLLTHNQQRVKSYDELKQALMDLPSDQ